MRDAQAQYKEFMYNPDNHCNCSECPENRGMDGWQGRFPCGQWKCWVDCHCERCEKDTESTF